MGSYEDEKNSVQPSNRRSASQAIEDFFRDSRSLFENFRTTLAVIVQCDNSVTNAIRFLDF